MMSVSPNTEGESITGPQLLHIDQTLICFDPEQTQNVQRVNIKRSIPDKVAFRWLTNAPTRYIVNPNRGILVDDKPLSVTIELLHQKFSPLHKMEIQGLTMKDNISGDAFIDKKRNDEIQRIPLQLGTTLMNLDKAEFLSKQGSISRSDSLITILDMEKNEDAKTQSLKELDELLKSDMNTISTNTKNTLELEQVLSQQLNVRKEELEDLRKKILEAKYNNHKLDEELRELENELKKVDSVNNTQSVTNRNGSCSLM